MTDIESTWKELGFSVRATGRKVFCRTILEKNTSLLVIPDQYKSFYYGDANKKILAGRVLSVGPEVKIIKNNDIICFRRMEFGRIWDFPDGTKGGWIDSAQVLGYDKAQSEADNVLLNRNEESSADGARV